MTQKAHEQAREEIDKMMILPAQYESMLIIGAQSDGNLLLVDKVGSPKTHFEMLAVAFIENPDLMETVMNVFSMLAYKTVKEKEANKPE